MTIAYEIAYCDEMDNEYTRIRNGLVSLYHGTRVSPNKILKEGLLIRSGHIGENSKYKMIDEALAEFGYSRNDVPSWVWEGEANYEKTYEPHLHFSCNIKTAIGYSHTGCETKYVVRKYLIWHILMRLLGNIKAKDLIKYDVDSVARKLNGDESFVYCVEIPINYIRPKDFEHVEKLIYHPIKECRELIKVTTLEVRVIENVPPEMIKRIWKVNWRDKDPIYGYDLIKIYESSL